MTKLTDAEKEVWDLLKHGPPNYELYSVNTFKDDERIIEVYGYININNKREFNVQVSVDGILLEKKDFRYWPDSLSIKDSYPVGCRVLINYPIEFECAITIGM